jgi:hypothetical protein
MSEEDDPHAELGEQDREAVPEDEVEDADEAHDEAVREQQEARAESMDDELRHEEARAETAEANAPDELPNDDRNE